MSAFFFRVKWLILGSHIWVNRNPLDSTDSFKAPCCQKCLKTVTQGCLILWHCTCFAPSKLVDRDLCSWGHMCLPNSQWFSFSSFSLRGLNLLCLPVQTVKQFSMPAAEQTIFTYILYGNVCTLYNYTEISILPSQVNMLYSVSVSHFFTGQYYVSPNPIY